MTETPDELARSLDELEVTVMKLQSALGTLARRVQALEGQPGPTAATPQPAFVGVDWATPKGRAGTAQRDNQAVLALVQKYAEENNVNPALIVGKCREQLISEIRQRIMHESELAGIGRKAIGRALGGRDHSTVAHGIRVHLKKEKTT